MSTKQQPFVYGGLLSLLAAFSVLGGCASNTANFHAMSEQDLVLADDAVQTALQTRISGDSISWLNQATGHRGTVTPVRSYKTKNGYFCREYWETVTISGATRQYRDTACRDRDGIWKPL